MAGIKNNDIWESKGVAAVEIAVGKHLSRSRVKNNTAMPNKAGGVLMPRLVNRYFALTNKELKNKRPIKNWPMCETKRSLEGAFLVDGDEIISPFFRIIDFKFFVI